MGFQTAVNIFSALGIPGELSFDGPLRAAPYNLYSDGQAQTIGFAFTRTSGGNPDPVGNSPLAGTAQVGGTGEFAGILINPKIYSAVGSSSNPLAASLNLPDYSIGTLMEMGFCFVYLNNAASVGDLLTFNTTTGAIASVAPTAAFTASQATTVLTVSAITAGNLGIGSVVNTGAEEVIIRSLGSGTGGAGTYNVDISQSVSSAAMTANSIAPSGYAFIPHGTVDRFDIATAGVAAVKLTN